MTESSRHSDAAIVWTAFGYFACYAPYSALTKAVSRGLLPGMRGGVDGMALLPVTAVASLLAMLAFMLLSGWWRYATRYPIAGRSVPGPTRLTLASGLATAMIIATTTLAYTFTGTSIVFMMLLMRGGVLVLAPLADWVGRRPVRAASWVALGLSLAALLVAFSGDQGLSMGWGAALDVLLYLGAYFFRLRWMSSQAKSEELSSNLRFFVEEQMVATPATVLGLLLGALFAPGASGAALQAGFTGVMTDPLLLPIGLLIGVLSQGTGVFGALILLDKRENSFCVPVNRASSILAGLVAAYTLSWTLDLAAPGAGELVGAGLVVAAILVLSASGIQRKK